VPVGLVIAELVAGGGFVAMPVGGGVFAGLGDEEGCGVLELGLEAAGVEDVMSVVGLGVDDGPSCRMSSCAKEVVGSMRERKRRVEENGRLDFVHWQARLLRVFRRISMMDGMFIGRACI
jgi:hypothetical protein